MREDLVGFGDGGGEFFAGGAVEATRGALPMSMKAVQTGRQRMAPSPMPAESGFIGTSDQVALHDRLVAGVLLQVEEEAVDNEDDDCGLVETDCG